MNKEIRKAIMVRSRLRKKFLEEKTAFSREAYNKQRNYCIKLIRESKIKYFGNFNVKNITDKKQGKNRLITDEKSIGKTFNDYFTSIIKHLPIGRNEFESKQVKLSNNLALSAVNRFQNDPSVLKTKSNQLTQALVFHR